MSQNDLLSQAREALGKIGELSAKATEPPWVAKVNPEFHPAHLVTVNIDADGRKRTSFVGVMDSTTLDNGANTYCIAAIRNSAPSLIAWVLAQADYIAALERLSTEWTINTASSERAALDAALSRFVEESGGNR